MTPSRLFSRALKTLAVEVPAPLKKSLWRLLEAARLRSVIERWARSVTTDAYLVSFPKCGRTWLRLMIGRALQAHFGLQATDAEILELEPLGRMRAGVPRILVRHARENPVVRTPDELTAAVLIPQGARAGKVILLVRDPRDVLVSLYHQRVKREKNYEGTLGAFVYEQRGSLETIVAYYNFWWAHRDVPDDVLLVRYEDLHEAPARQLRRVLAFVGLPGVSQRTVEQAVRHGRFENMRKLEKDPALTSTRLSPGGERGERDLADEEAYKTRKGKVGGFRDELTEAEIAYANAYIDEHLHRAYGYAEGPAAR